jgi:hypothetical protein
VPIRVAAVAVLALVALAAPAAADTPQPLQGITGPTFVISLVDAAGNDVKAIDAPGTYTINVDDRSELHNFHLVGPGVDQATIIEQVGMQSWTVPLAEGTYRFFCDPHADLMRGSFTVGTPPTTPPPPTLQKLAARIGPGQRLVFVAKAKAGKTQITVRDLTAADNFHLVGPGVNKKTGVKFKGSVKWTVTLKKGVYTFRSDAHAKLKGKTTVT